MQLDTGSVHPIVKRVHADIWIDISTSFSMGQLAILSGKLMLFPDCSQNIFQSFNSDSSDDGDGISNSQNCNLHVKSFEFISLIIAAGTRIKQFYSQHQSVLIAASGL